MPNFRVRSLETVSDAHSENPEGLEPSKTLGEDVFDGLKPHPDAALILFVQQTVTSALPMAYYMAARRGSDSLMDTRFPKNTTLSSQTLRSAMCGLTALRETELRKTSNRLQKFQPCRLSPDELSLLTLWGTFEHGNHWSTPTNSRSDYGACDWRDEYFTGAIGQ